MATDSHDFRDDILGEVISLGNGVSYTVKNIVNQGGNGAYVDLQYTNASGDTLTFQVHKNSNGESWIQQMVAHSNDGKSINLIKDNYRANLSDAQIRQAQNIVSSTQLEAQKAMLTQLPNNQQLAAQESINQAQAQITESEKQLNEAKVNLDAMKEPTYTSYTRSSLLGGGGY